jgi:hypothetical protein
MVFAGFLIRLEGSNLVKPSYMDEEKPCPPSQFLQNVERTTGPGLVVLFLLE